MPTAAEWFAPTSSNVTHTNGCVINSQVGGDHAYCECECHEGTLPAIPPSRERRSADERNALINEVAELKRKIAELAIQRDALLVQNGEIVGGV